VGHLLLIEDLVGELWGHHECCLYFCIYIGLRAHFVQGSLTPILYRVGGTHFVPIGVRGLTCLWAMYMLYFFVNIYDTLIDIYIYIWIYIHFGIFVMFTCVDIL
jgi:hypothetical protein